MCVSGGGAHTWIQGQEDEVEQGLTQSPPVTAVSSQQPPQVPAVRAGSRGASRHQLPSRRWSLAALTPPHLLPHRVNTRPLSALWERGWQLFSASSSSVLASLLVQETILVFFFLYRREELMAPAMGKGLKDQATLNGFKIHLS